MGCNGTLLALTLGLCDTDWNGAGGAGWPSYLAIVSQSCPDFGERRLNSMITARVLVRLNGITEDMHARDIADYEVVEITAQADTWEAARDAALAKVGEGNQALSISRELG